MSDLPSLEHPAEAAEPEAEPEAEVEAGDECPVCGRRGRAEGHH